MKSCWVWTAVVVVFCLVPQIHSFASIPVKTVTHYRVSTRGFSIGDVVTTQHASEEGGNNQVRIETKTSVKASFLWFGYQLTSNEKGILQDGILVGYSRKGQENGAMIDVEGRLDNAAFRFDVREHGGTRSIVFPRSSYDYTTLECPEVRIDFSVKPQITLRVLDVEKLTVVKRVYRFVSNGHFTVAGKEYPCRIVDFSDQNKKARRWISWDGKSVVMYRQDGKGDKSSYSVQATLVSREL